MFDDLRDQANPSLQEESSPTAGPVKTAAAGRGRFLGMTPPQRFVIAILLFLMVCVLGSFCLLLTEKVVLPFF